MTYDYVSSHGNWHRSTYDLPVMRSKQSLLGKVFPVRLGQKGILEPRQAFGLGKVSNGICARDQ